MLSLNNLRIIFTSHGLQHSHQLWMNKACLSKVSSYVTLNNCLTFNSNKGTRQRNSLRLLKERELKYTTIISSQRLFSTTHVKQNCWNCSQPIEETPAFFCLSCNVLQPPDESASFFQIMDCDQTFAINTEKLQKRYLHLQRSLHPDNFSQKKAKEQEFSEHQSALVNKAYRTLLKPLSRGLYMLELQSMHLEEGTDPGADPQLLLELMEMNEALQEARSPEDVHPIGQATKERLKDLTEQIDTSMRKGELQTAKELLSQMKYFANIEDKVKEKLSELM
ncbi:iron-sulfur cluster co-chaperone protein HscB [Hypomesus transpacificus]|uniref:iron-sulfur cluster co-chaperone protein HscB n=1 Tax=Hypomesus transpacificus TaxID=137520 RepID=UPI001F07D0AD|nr:iron-sulfur cluster co-chaperone protein HscB [Hypomesus transpacificus]